MRIRPGLAIRWLPRGGRSHPCRLDHSDCELRKLAAGQFDGLRPYVCADPDFVAGRGEVCVGHGRIVSGVEMVSDPTVLEIRETRMFSKTPALNQFTGSHTKPLWSPGGEAAADPE